MMKWGFLVKGMCFWIKLLLLHHTDIKTIFPVLITGLTVMMIQLGDAL